MRDGSERGALAAENGAESAVVENPLSEREMDVAELLVTGVSNAEIARGLTISPHTVKVHLRNIYEKLQVNSRTEATMTVLQRGWVTLPGVEPLSPSDETIGDPEPLPDLPAFLVPWQRVYLISVLSLTLLALVFPLFLRSQSSAKPPLLSDAPMSGLGQATIIELPRWERRTPLPNPRSRLNLVAQGDSRLVAIGGESSNGTLLDSVDVYDLTVNEWNRGPSLPISLANAAAAATDEHIFVAGGLTVGEGEVGSISDRVWLLGREDERWREMGPLPVALAGSSLVYSQNALYLIGGWDGESMRGEIWRAELGADLALGPEDWLEIARLEEPRAFLGATAVDDEIYIAGGYDGRRELDSAGVLNIRTGATRPLPPLSSPRGGLSLVYDGLAIFAIGGGWLTPVDTLERYDPATGLWSNSPMPIVGVWRGLGAAANTSGDLFLAGGWSSEYLNIHLHFQSSFRTFLPSTRKTGGN